MAKIIDFHLFPSSDEWGTGDEALDLKLTNQLKLIKDNLSINGIENFYFEAINLKMRMSNPYFKRQIELVTKALLYSLDPDSYIDIEFNKLIGHYHHKEKINFTLEKLDILHDGLLMLKKFRYEDLLDFYMVLESEPLINPFVEHHLKNAPQKLDIKIIMKETRLFLQGKGNETHPNSLINQLKNGKYILEIKTLGEVWFDEDKIYAVSKI